MFILFNAFVTCDMWDIDKQDLYKMWVHTLVAFAFLVVAQFLPLLSVQFEGIRNPPIEIGIHDSDKCSGDCGAIHAENDNITAGSICIQIALGLSALTLILDSGLVPNGKGKHISGINNRGMVFFILILKVIVLLVGVITLASFAGSPNAFTVPGMCDNATYIQATGDTDLNTNRFWSTTYGGILPTSLPLTDAAAPADNKYASCTDASTCLKDFVNNHCKVLDGSLADTDHKADPSQHIFMTEFVDVQLNSGYMLVFFATAITIAQTVTFMADHISPPKGRRGGYKHHVTYQRADESGRFRGRGSRVAPEGV